MKYIKNGKLVLNGEMQECDLEDKLLKALELIVNKRVNYFDEIQKIKTYSQYLKKYDYLEDCFILNEAEWKLLKELA